MRRRDAILTAQALALAAAAMRSAVAMPAIAEALRGFGVDAIGGDRREFDAVLQADIAVWRPLIRELGLRADR